MTKKRILRIGVPVLSLVVVGLIGIAFGASAGGFLNHGGFHGAAMHCMINQLIEDLDLNAEQQQRLESLHQSLQSQVANKREAHAQHHQWLVDQISQGNIDSQEVRDTIDQHIQELRTVAFSVSDELVPLLNSLDETQRATLLAHIEQAHSSIGHMPGHGSE